MLNSLNEPLTYKDLQHGSVVRLSWIDERFVVVFRVRIGHSYCISFVNENEPSKESSFCIHGEISEPISGFEVVGFMSDWTRLAQYMTSFPLNFLRYKGVFRRRR